MNRYKKGGIGSSGLFYFLHFPHELLLLEASGREVEYSASVAFCSGDEHFWTETHLKSSSVYLAAQINKKKRTFRELLWWSGTLAYWATSP